ncbi:MAG: MFS transporter [Clostridia bacterium]|nr:MFS transporter [Clostridia bacterium]
MEKTNEMALNTENIVSSDNTSRDSSVLKTYTSSERNWYLVGLAGQNVIYNIIGAALAYYLQFTLLIPALTVSIIMAAARVWDAFNDPMMGTIVDRTRSKWGKCRPYLMIVPIPILIITIACFTNFGFYGDGTVSNSLIVFWAAFTYILWGMIYTLGDIPLWSATSLMTESDKDKTKLLSLARVAGGIGGGITLLGIQPLALGLGSMLTNTAIAGGNAAIGEKYGFLLAAIIFGIIGTAVFIPLGFKIRERIPANGTKYSMVDNFKIAIKNKPFRQIIMSGILSSTKMLIALAAMPLVTYYFSSKNALLALLYMALLGGGMFIGQFVAMAFTPKLLGRFSTKNLYNGSNILGIVPYLLIFIAYLIAPSGLTNVGWIIACFGLFFVCGASGGVTTVLQSTMIANAVDYEEYTNNRRPDAVFFSGQTFVTKLQSGIATIISGIAYTIVGFSDSRVQELNAYITAGGTPRLVGEYGSFMMILFLIVSILPAIGCLLAIIPTWNYCLDDDEHKRILAVLHARRDAALRGETLTAEEELKIIATDEYVIIENDITDDSEK